MFIFDNQFFTEPDTIQVKPELWLLESPFWYRLANGEILFVPPSGLGSVSDMIEHPIWTTDYGSIPAVFQNLFSPTYYSAAYLLHDWLYCSEMFDRARCDWILLEALQDLGANWLVRNVIYSAVKAGGWAVWRKHDPKKVALLRDYAKAAQILFPLPQPAA